MKSHLIILSSIIFSSASLFSQGDSKHSVEVIASSDRQWTGIAVSQQKRIFVNFPYWSDDVPISVAEIIEGKAVPYPNAEWNSREKKQSFHAVQSVVIDAKNRLWALETNNAQFKGVRKPGPILYQFDLKENKMVKAYQFPESSYRSDSYYNDVRFDCEKEIAYISDSGHGAIIVLDLKTGKSRRLLEGHPSVKSELKQLICDGHVWKNSVDVDGVALTKDNQYLYYIALTGHTLYRIKTSALNDPDLSPEQLAKQVEKVATVPATDGMMFSPDGTLWLGGLENNAINNIDKQHKLTQIVQDPIIRWPDSFSITKDGSVYFTTAQIHLPKEKQKQFQILTIK